MPSRFHAKTPSRHLRITWPRVLGVAVVLILIFAAGRHWLSIDTLRTHRDALLQFVTAHHWAALALLGLVTVAQTAISLPFSPFLVILAGMVFGLWMGTAFMVVTTSLGSVLAMLVVRYLAQGFARARVRRHAKAQRMLEAFGRHPNSYLLFLRFEPGMPLWLANIVCGLTDIGLLRFSFLTFVGVIPDTFVFANIGAHLARVRSAHELLSPGLIIAFALLAVLALVPVAIGHLLRRG